jgi:hypothetical protein
MCLAEAAATAALAAGEKGSNPSPPCIRTRTTYTIALRNTMVII